MFKSGFFFFSLLILTSQQHLAAMNTSSFLWEVFSGLWATTNLSLFSSSVAIHFPLHNSIYSNTLKNIRIHQDVFPIIICFLILHYFLMNCYLFQRNELPSVPHNLYISVLLCCSHLFTHVANCSLKSCAG